MALTQIRQANKRWRKQQRRDAKIRHIKHTKEHIMAKVRAMESERRKARLAQINYVKQLENEVGNEAQKDT